MSILIELNLEIIKSQKFHKFPKHSLNIFRHEKSDLQII